MREEFVRVKCGCAQDSRRLSVPCPSALSTVWAPNPTPAFLIFASRCTFGPLHLGDVVVPKSNAETDVRESSMLPAVLPFSRSPVPQFSMLQFAAHDLLAPHISGSARSMDLAHLAVSEVR